jgi:hypothetical protein
VRVQARGIAAGALALGLALALAGCTTRNTLVPNLAPETTIFVQGPVDTVNHVVHLFWFGSDQDGFVQGYEVRFLNPANVADSGWVITPKSDSLFIVYTPGGVTSPVFQVRAIDDEGVRDPSPASQAFTFDNQPPSVALVSPPAPDDTTFASLTLTWKPTDVDGDLDRMRYLVWLDGGQDTALATSTTFTVPTVAFRQNGQLLSGPRSVFVRPIDDGGMAGPEASATWYVRAPVTGSRARLLIVDDVPSTNAANLSTDTMYTNTAARNIPAGEWSVLTLETNQPFASDADVFQTFSLFEAVVWYRGTEVAFSPVLGNRERGVSDYLDAGGNLMLEGFHLVDGLNVNGALTPTFVRDHMGADRLWSYFESSFQDSSSNWGINNAQVLHATGLQDSLRIQGIYVGLRGFVVRDTDDVLIWARAGTLSQPHTMDIPVAVTVPQDAGGRLIATTIPMRAANGYLSVPRFLAKAFAQLGIFGP